MKFHGAPLLFTPVLLLFITALFSRSFALEFNRGSFPAGFIFGAASSAYQVSRRILETSQLSFENIIMCLQYEGAAREGGRGPSIWDTFTHKHPERIADGSNGDIAIDHYHHYKEDVKLMKNIGLDAYRFSISWSRIFPNGSLSGGVNKEGINHYNKFIDELILNGVQPFVTLFHFDSPQGLEQKYGSFLSPNIVNDFRNYAEICFREFGDRVKHWITFNEPWSFAVGGYAEGFLAPARCSPWESTKCDEGDSGREPYIVAHNLLIAHASAVKLYRNKYKARQKGKIGIILVSNWFVPYSNTKSNRDASERALDFMFGWFMDPLTTGDYPFIMRVLVGSRLPKYTEEESKLVKGSYDFIGLNYYTTNYVDNLPALNMMNKTYTTDSCLNKTGMRNGIQIGPRAASSWLYIYPRGIRDLLLYINAKYNHPVIYITENGVDEVSNGTLSLEEALKDDARIDFHQRHLYYIQRAIRNGADVRGYFAWSLLDNFEWMDGFTVRFGINYVAYNDGLKRYPKNSALWFKKFLKR